MKILFSIKWLFSIWLFLNPLLAQNASQSLINQVSRDNLEATISDLADASGTQSRVSFTEGNRWAVTYLKEKLENVPGNHTVTLDTFRIPGASAPYNFVNLFNVVATIDGTTTPENIIVIGGHFDSTADRDPALTWNSQWSRSIAPGADDNATGVAAVIEMLRILSDPQNGYSPDYTLKFVLFGAEERHPVYDDNHYGSMVFAQRLYNTRKPVIGVYNIDMIGYNNTGNDHVEIVANTTSAFLGDYLREVRDNYDLALHMNQPPYPASTYSDHDSFWLYRFPAILLIENAPPWEDNLPWYLENPVYHHQTDAVEELNMSQVELVTKLVLAAVADQAMTPTGVRMAEFVEQRKKNISVAAYPNPFREALNIHVMSFAGAPIEVDIVSVNGAHVRSFETRDEQIVWDGTTSSGKTASAGVYFVVIQVGEIREVVKVLKL